MLCNLISNKTSTWLFNHSTNFNIQMFDFVFESSKENVRKPDPEFYLQACERGEVNPAEGVFLDDLGINLKPAKKLGMKTIKVINSSEALTELDSLIDIKLF